MAILEGTTVEVTDEGYLVNINDWSDEVVEAIAKVDGIELTEKHWDIIKYLRDEHVSKGEEPNERTIVKAMKSIWGGKPKSKDCFQLFPNAPSKQGRKFAGLPKSNRKGGY
ncbi:MAG: TusE/DsrC/DsvC family sulfur relay protein [Cocleimonas sp.]|nr:TusE/DsrC/DsvC family sulfur relay protein [Cocleimonas sp.]